MRDKCCGDGDLTVYVFDIRTGGAGEPEVARHLEDCGRCRRRVLDEIAPRLALGMRAYRDEMGGEQAAGTGPSFGSVLAARSGGRRAGPAGRPGTRPGVRGVCALALSLGVTLLLAVAASPVSTGGFHVLANTDHSPFWSTPSTWQPAGAAWLVFGVVLLASLVPAGINLAMIAAPRVGALERRLARR